MKKILYISSLAVVAIIIILALSGLIRFNFVPDNSDVLVQDKLDPLNMSYMIGGEKFALINGKAENTYTPDSATKNILTVFGQPVLGDLNGDDIIDAAVLLENNPGGSGTFYYAVLILSTSNSFKPTNAMLLGDRIAPQTVEIHDGRAVYNFAERKAGEPFTTPPSIGKSVWVYYDVKTGEIGEWVKGFEGESNL